MPRIITGTAKNKHLKVPESARPMTDMAKSGLFSMINSRIPNAKVLDLYAGSGALGLECLSRGAIFAKFVEITIGGFYSILDNIQNCKFDVRKNASAASHYDIPTGTIVQSDVIKYLQKVLNKYERNSKDEFEKYEKELKFESFDIIFVCPPHVDVNNESIILASQLLNNDGILIAECPFDKVLPDTLHNIYIEDKRRYGKTDLYFYLTNSQK